MRRGTRAHTLAGTTPPSSASGPHAFVSNNCLNRLLDVSRDRSVLGAAVNHRWTTALLALVIGVILALSAFLTGQVFAVLVA